jgi:hypothetical protein
MRVTHRRGDLFFLLPCQRPEGALAGRSRSSRPRVGAEAQQSLRSGSREEEEWDSATEILRHDGGVCIGVRPQEALAHRLMPTRPAIEPWGRDPITKQVVVPQADDLQAASLSYKTLLQRHTHITPSHLPDLLQLLASGGVHQLPPSGQLVCVHPSAWRDVEFLLGDAESALGDAKSSLGDAESSLGDAGHGHVAIYVAINTQRRPDAAGGGAAERLAHTAAARAGRGARRRRRRYGHSHPREGPRTSPRQLLAAPSKLLRHPASSQCTLDLEWRSFRRRRGSARRRGDAAAREPADAGGAVLAPGPPAHVPRPPQRRVLHHVRQGRALRHHRERRPPGAPPPWVGLTHTWLGSTHTGVNTHLNGVNTHPAGVHTHL